MASGTRAARPSGAVRILEVDRELGAELPPDELEVASRYAVARTTQLERGLYPHPARIGNPALLGLMIVEGLMVRSVQVAERRCGELVGAGALLRPWDHFGDLAPMPFEVHWRVLEPVRMALLDERMVAVSARWPKLMHALVKRAVERSHALALNVAIHCLQHVELRLLVLLWHLADRFGHVSSEGVVIPLKLSHGDLAELIGSQRPSVSSRLAMLAERGEVVRRPDRTWLLLGEPPQEVKDMRARAQVPVGDGLVSMGDAP